MTTQFTTGRDITLTVVTSSGQLTFDLITAFQSKQNRTVQPFKGIDGVPRHQPFFNGWEGRFDMERNSPILDDYFGQLEQDYYNGIKELPASITQIILESNGVLKQYRYIGVYLMFEDAGEYKTDSTVKQTVQFVGERRLNIQ